MATTPTTDADTADDPTVSQPEHDAPVYPRWKWRTFPVFMAFVCGLLIASFANGQPQNDLAALVQILAVLGLGYCIAHLFVVNVVIAGRIKRRGAALARGETPPDDLETELVYPDDNAPASED